MVKLLIAFLIGFLSCIAVGAHRRRVNQPRVEVYTQSGKRIR